MTTPDTPESGAAADDIAALINARGLDVSLREVFQTLVLTTHPGGGAVLSAVLNFHGNTFHVRLDCDLLSIPNAGSRPELRH